MTVKDFISAFTSNAVISIRDVDDSLIDVFILNRSECRQFLLEQYGEYPITVWGFRKECIDIHIDYNNGTQN